jgi:hypothetical protein
VISLLVQVTLLACHFKYSLRHLLNRLNNLRTMAFT